MSDDPQPFMVVQDMIEVFYLMREAAGVVFIIGLVLYVIRFLWEERSHLKRLVEGCRPGLRR